MKKIIIFVIVVGAIVGFSFLKLFSIKELTSPPPRPDFTVISQQDYNNLVENMKVTRRVNLWEYLQQK